MISEPEVVSGADAVWHAKAESGRIPNAKNLAGTSQAKLGSGVVFPKGVQVPDGAVYGSPEHAKVPPGGCTVYWCPPALIVCGGTKRVVCGGADPTCAAASTSSPSFFSAILCRGSQLPTLIILAETSSAHCSDTPKMLGIHKLFTP